MKPIEEEGTTGEKAASEQKGASEKTEQKGDTEDKEAGGEGEFKEAEEEPIAVQYIYYQER